MDDDAEQNAVAAFRAVIQKVKDGYLTKTAKKATPVDIEQAERDIFRLGNALIRYIQTLQMPGHEGERKTIEFFKKFGGLDFLEANSASKGLFEYYATLDCKTYPLTLSQRHIDMLKKHNEPSPA